MCHSLEYYYFVCNQKTFSSVYLTSIATQSSYVSNMSISVAMTTWIMLAAFCPVCLDDKLFVGLLLLLLLFFSNFVVVPVVAVVVTALDAASLCCCYCSCCCCYFVTKATDTRCDCSCNVACDVEKNTQRHTDGHKVRCLLIFATSACNIASCSMRPHLKIYLSLLLRNSTRYQFTPRIYLSQTSAPPIQSPVSIHQYTIINIRPWLKPGIEIKVVLIFYLFILLFS